MKIYLGADHRGFHLKEELKSWLIQQSHEVVDVGASSLVPDDDYVDFASEVAHNVSSNRQQSAVSGRHDAFGVAICGSGVGVDIVANKVHGIRCGLGISPEQIKAARSEDNINVLALSSDESDISKVKEIVLIFLNTPFSEKDRYKRRIEKIRRLETSA